jgi:uncharacterized OsmC-like protein
MATGRSQAEALDGFIARIESEPRRADVTFRITAGLGPDGLSCEVPVRHHALTVDEPKSIGGADLGPNPVEAALAALAGCQAITYRLWAAKLGVRVDRIEVEAEGDMDVRGYVGMEDAVRPGPRAVRLHVRLEGPEPPERYRELAELADAHCPLLDFTANPVPVERRLDLG